MNDLSICDQLKIKREIEQLSLDPVPRNWNIMAQDIMESAPQRYLDILRALCKGDSITKVVKDLHVRKEVARAIRDRHPGHLQDAQARAIRANLHDAIHAMSESMIDKVDEIPAGKMGYNFSALLDKALLMEGQATSRVEHIKVSSPEDLKKLYEQLPEA